jgi:hypothetical protein
MGKELYKAGKNKSWEGTNYFKEGKIVIKKIIESNDELNIKRNEYCKLQTQEISQEKFICMICNKVNKH